NGFTLGTRKTKAAQRERVTCCVFGARSTRNTQHATAAGMVEKSRVPYSDQAVQLDKVTFFTLSPCHLVTSGNHRQHPRAHAVAQLERAAECSDALAHAEQPEALPRPAHRDVLLQRPRVEAHAIVRDAQPDRVGR